MPESSAWYRVARTVIVLCIAGARMAQGADTQSLPQSPVTMSSDHFPIGLVRASIAVSGVALLSSVAQPDSVPEPPQTFWQRFRWDLSIVSIMLLIQGAITVLLLYQFRRRMNAEQSLRESQARIAMFSEYSHDVIYQLHPDGTVINISRQIHEYGYEPEAIIGKRLRNIIDESYHERAIAYFVASLQGQERPTTLQFELVAADGSRHWVEAQSKTLRNADGQPIEHIGFLRDIADRKRYERELEVRVEERTRDLRESEQQYRTIFNATSDAITVFDPDSGRIVDANRRMVELLGYSPEELVECNVDTLSAGTPPYSRVESAAFVARAMEGSPQLFPWRNRKRNGELVWTEISLTKAIVKGQGKTLAVIRDITNRKKNEEALYEHRKLLRYILDTVPQAIFWKNIHGVYQGCNQNFAAVAGLDSPDDIIGKTDYELPWHEAADSYLRADREVIKSNQVIRRIVEPAVTADGKYLWVETTKCPLVDAEGRVTGVLGIFDDITDRKRAEERLNESHRILMTLMSNLPGMVYRCLNDHNWTMTFVSEGCKELTGYTEPELLNNRCVAFGDLIRPDFREHVWENVQQALERDVSFELTYPIIAVDGKERWVWERGRGIFDGERNLHFVEGFITDVTERKNVEATLLQSEERFRRIFASAQIGIALTLPSKAWLEVNDRMCEITGYSRDELARITWAEMTHPDDLDKDLALFNRVLSGELDDYSMEKRYVHKTGRPVHARLSVQCLRKPDRSVEYFVSMVEDITERRMLEQQLLQAQKMDAIGTLAGGIAHDFNNILSAISGNLDLAREDAPANAVLLLESLSEAMKATERATGLVRQILSFSRQSTAERRMVQLNSLVREVAGLLRATIPSTIVMEVAVPNEPVVVFADITQLHQVIMNLGTNAFHAMRGTGGTLNITLTTIAPEESHSVPLRHGPSACITVSDTGIGMDKSTLERIFEPFFTTKPLGEGTGLGLSVVHGIVKNHDGAILVESEAGKGSQFRVLLPLADKVEESSEPDAMPSDLHGQGERILVVDDEPALVTALERRLSRIGYHVVGTTDSRQALESILQSPGSFDMLVTDQTMPHLTGLALAKRIHKVIPGFPVLVCTGYSDEMLVRNEQADGVCQMLLKPVSRCVLAKAMREALRGRPAASNLLG